MAVREETLNLKKIRFLNITRLQITAVQECHMKRLDLKDTTLFLATLELWILNVVVREIDAKFQKFRFPNIPRLQILSRYRILT